VRSYFVPDEYWQSLEVSHNLVFGYGYLTWEWQDHKLRSVLHPLIYAGLYWVLKVTRTDWPWLVAYLPRLLNGGLLYLTDRLVLSTASKMYGPEVGRTSWILFLTTWFVTYAGVRTYANSMEMVLTAAALYCIAHHYTVCTDVFVSLNFVMRPTSAVFWLPYYFSILLDYRRLLQAVSVA
jgi:phosphatidylinositol glycan class B